MNATPIKLRSGAWGAKTSSKIRKGDIVTITTRAGKSWQARVERVVWRGDGVSLCATESIDRPNRRSSGGRGSRGRWTGCQCGSIEDYPRDSDCASCQHDY